MKENHLIGNILDEMEGHSVGGGRDRPSQLELAKLASMRSSSAPPVMPKAVSNFYISNRFFEK